jgi:arylsulfatase A-like enzyme
MGLYDDTIFVVYGDHGEGFGEHGRYLHGDTIYEEG